MRYFFSPLNTINLNTIYYSNYFIVSAPGLRVPSHTNPGPVQSCLTGHSKLKTYEHLDVQFGVQNDQKATCSAISILLYALTLLSCSLFRMSGQDSAVKSTLQLYAQRFYE
jgi:hypothetical protein